MVAPRLCRQPCSRACPCRRTLPAHHPAALRGFLLRPGPHPEHLRLRSQSPLRRFALPPTIRRRSQSPHSPPWILPRNRRRRRQPVLATLWVSSARFPRSGSPPPRLAPEVLFWGPLCVSLQSSASCSLRSLSILRKPWPS